jgi:integrase
MYNKDLKLRFVSEYDAKTGKTYLSDLVRISSAENYFKKDMFNFSLEQIDEALKGIKFKKESSIVRSVSTYRQYAAWANQNGFVPSKTNLWELLTKDKLNEYVWDYAYKNSFITRDQLYEVISKLVNSVDYLPILLAFEGVYGKQMSEIRNLKYDDINFSNGLVRLTDDDGSKRTIKIEDKRTLEILQMAKNQTTYQKNNGKSDGGFLLGTARVIVTPYVVRKMTTKEIKKDINLDDVYYGDEPVGLMAVEARFSRIFRGNRNPNPDKHKDPFVEGYTFLNATNIFKSGYMDYCSKREAEKGEGLNMKDFENACIRFGLSPNLSSPYKQQYLEWKEKVKENSNGD